MIDRFVHRHGLDRDRVAAGHASGSRRLDLPAIVRRQLERIGVQAVAGRCECTMCHTRTDGRWTFHGYRRDRETRMPAADVHRSAIASADRQSARADRSSVPSTTR